MHVLVIFSVILLNTFNSHSTNYYLSTSGDDSKSGTSPAQAWKSLKQLNDFVPKPGDSILFRRGDEWSGTIAVNMWGFEGKPVVYGAYGRGAKPRIYGSEIITGWIKHSKNIYKARFSKKINQVFINDERMTVARHPNIGYLFISSTEGSDKFIADELNSGIDYTGAKWFGRTYYYTTDLKEVISSSSKSITLNEAPRKPLKNGLGFFLMNKLEFLDQPGEWFYDEVANTIYLWTPKGDSPGNYIIRGSVHEDGFYIGSKDHIVIQDFEILQQANTGINSVKSDNILISGNDISYMDGFGISSPQNALHVTISNNTIKGVNHYGIFGRLSYSLIADNEISEVALFENIGLTGTGEDNYGGGVYIAGEEGNNVIRHNRITETGYNGILFAKPNNIIEYNFIKNVCLLKGDNGGIYTSWYNRSEPAGPEGSIIRNNIILNVVGEKYGYTSGRDFGEGIYIDRSARGVTIENNTIAHCTNSGIYIHQVENTVVRKNTIFDARQSIHVVKYSGTGKSSISENIMVAASDKDDYLKRQVFINISAGNALFENNKYINPYATDGIFKCNSPYYDFDEWKSFSGQDANSVVNLKPLVPGEKEHLYYNDTKQLKTIELGNQLFKDIDGNNVTGTIELQPFTSIILFGK